MESLVHKKETQKHQCDQCDATYLNKNILKYLMVSTLVLMNLLGTFVVNSSPVKEAWPDTNYSFIKMAQRSNLMNVKIVDRASQ